MQVELRAGAHLTLLSQEDMAKEVSRLGDLWREVERERAGETLRVPAASFTTTATGKGTAVVYRVPQGFDAWIVRATFDYPTSNAKTGHACDIRLCYGSDTPSNLLAVNATIPSVYEASRNHAPFVRGGSQIVAAIKTGPVSTSIWVSVQVILVSRTALKRDPTQRPQEEDRS